MTEGTQQNSGLHALILIAGYHGIAIDADKLIHDQATHGKTFSEREILVAAKRNRFKAKTRDVRYEKLLNLTAPYMAQLGEV